MGEKTVYMCVSTDTISPDIIIYNTLIFKYMPHGYNIKNNIINTLSYYISYDLPIVKTLHYEMYSFGNDDLLPAWRRFVHNRQTYYIAMQNPITNGLNCVVSWHPMFDAYLSEFTLALPPKFQGKDKIIMYEPHHSMGNPHSTSFHMYYKQMLVQLNKYPNIGFVFKPHPLLKQVIRNCEENHTSGMPTLKEYEEYCRLWAESSNGVIVDDSSFIDWFRQCDCLITCRFSFMNSWLPTEKPLIYLKCPSDSDDFSEYVYGHNVPMIESYYICDNEPDIKKLIEEVVIGGVDPKADKRKLQKDILVHNLGNAGEFIADYIERQLKE